MKKKALRVVALAMVMCLCLTGCGSKDSTETNNDNPSVTGSENQNNTGSTQTGSTETGNTETGNTETGNTETGSTETVEKELYQAYDLGGITLTLLKHNDMGALDPESAETDYEKAEKQEHLDYIQNKYNVKLEFVDITTEDWDNLDAEIVSAYTSGHPVADVMDAYYQFLDTYVANDILYDMTADFAKTDAFKDTSIVNWCGSKWGVSVGMGGEGLYYNKEWIEELGMEYTPAEMFDMGMWDYENCYQYLKELKSKMAEDEYPLFVAPYYWGLWATHANGTKIWKDDGNLGYIDEAYIECFEFLQKLINEGLAAIPDRTESGGYNNWGYPGNTFDKGETVAIAHRAAWQAAGLVDSFELGYVPYPWGSNVSLDESKIGQSGAYLTLDDNYMGSYYDGQALVLTKGVEKKGDPLAIMTMLTELMGFDSCMSAYTASNDEVSCAWLEDGIDKDLYVFCSNRETCEFFNSINSVDFTVAFNGTIYGNKSVRSEFESFYNADMAAMIEAGYATPDMMTPTN